MSKKKILSDEHEIRTCILCKNRDERKNLIRIALQNSCIVIDERKDKRGRGAHLHAQCMMNDKHFAKVLTKGFLSRVFKEKNFEGSTSALEALCEQFKKKMSQE